MSYLFPFFLLYQNQRKLHVSLQLYKSCIVSYFWPCLWHVQWQYWILNLLSYKRPPVPHCLRVFQRNRTNGTQTESPSIYPSFHPSIHPPIHPLIHPSICLSREVWKNWLICFQNLVTWNLHSRLGGWRPREEWWLEPKGLLIAEFLYTQDKFSLLVY